MFLIVSFSFTNYNIKNQMNEVIGSKPLPSNVHQESKPQLHPNQPKTERQ
jgi:hypothetical protein